MMVDLVERPTIPTQLAKRSNQIATLVSILLGCVVVVAGIIAVAHLMQSFFIALGVLVIVILLAAARWLPQLTPSDSIEAS